MVWQKMTNNSSGSTSLPVGSDGQSLVFNQNSQTWQGQYNNKDLGWNQTKKATVVFVFDDTSDFYFNNRNVFSDRGVRFTTGLRQDFLVGGAAATGLTWDMVKTMNDEGFEIAYHGMHHNYGTDKTTEYTADISTYLNLTDANNIPIKGFIGPNGDNPTNVVYGVYGDRLKWSAGGEGGGSASVMSPVDYIKDLPSSFIDDLTTDAALTSVKTSIDGLSTRGTGLIVLRNHWTSQIMPYTAQLLDYIIAKGNIDILTASQAYERYGPLYEFYDSSITDMGTLLWNKRQDGNGPDSYNIGKPHFLVQKDGTVMSNYTPVKVSTPTKGSIKLNGNSSPSTFDFGTTIIQYGSTDDSGGVGIGTLFNYNYGRNVGHEQFQIVKGYSSGGFFLREVDQTTGTWNTSGFTDKLGVFRATKPTSSTSSGSKGDWSADASYLYICYADNNWIRIPKDTVTW